MLKPLTQQLAFQEPAYSGGDYYDTSGDCCHPVLAIEPRNPATPPRAFKIHKQRTVNIILWELSTFYQKNDCTVTIILFNPTF